MARPKITDRSASPGMPHQAEHDKMMSEMHDTLYTLGDKVRKAFPDYRKPLLPAHLKPKPTPESKEAKRHIELLHSSFKTAAKKGK